MESLVLEGLVEAIIFKSEDTGYTVAKITANKELITIVGVMPLLQEGQQIEVKGKFIQHKQFGRQFSVEEYKEKLPSSSKEIEKYLSTGIIRGIGPVTAKKIVKAFGKDTLDILDNHIERLKEVEGIGEKKFNIIYESYIETKDLKDIMIFFQKHGMTVNQCLKIYKKFGADSINKVSINPYILNDEISGIGFLTADKIAKEFGVEDTSSFRIQSGIRYVLNNFSAMGNTYMPKDKLIQECQKVLAVSRDIVEENIYNCVLEEKLKIEKIKDEEPSIIIIRFVDPPVEEKKEEKEEEKQEEVKTVNFEFETLHTSCTISGYEYCSFKEVNDKYHKCKNKKNIFKKCKNTDTHKWSKGKCGECGAWHYNHTPVYYDKIKDGIQGWCTTCGMKWTGRGWVIYGS